MRSLWSTPLRLRGLHRRPWRLYFVSAPLLVHLLLLALAPAQSAAAHSHRRARVLAICPGRTNLADRTPRSPILLVPVHTPVPPDARDARVPMTDASKTINPVRGTLRASCLVLPLQ
ncbi:hypothetical protein C8R45DRAFT_1102098 [Mycena sanguinolenta]|nr:hypothetical protein C8R45DRAFT_1102098 [Mycena sanguinolenta]